MISVSKSYFLGQILCKKLIIFFILKPEWNFQKQHCFFCFDFWWFLKQYHIFPGFFAKGFKNFPKSQLLIAILSTLTFFWPCVGGNKVMFPNERVSFWAVQTITIIGPPQFFKTEMPILKHFFGPIPGFKADRPSKAHWHFKTQSDSSFQTVTVIKSVSTKFAFGAMFYWYQLGINYLNWYSSNNFQISKDR